MHFGLGVCLILILFVSVISSVTFVSQSSLSENASQLILLLKTVRLIEAKFAVGGIDIEICNFIGEFDGIHLNNEYETIQHLGARIHTINKTLNIFQSEEHKNLYCATRVAEHKFVGGSDTAHILFVSPRMLISDRVLFDLTESILFKNRFSVALLPLRPLQVFSFTSVVGAQLQLFYNSSTWMNLSPMEVLNWGLQYVAQSVEYYPSRSGSAKCDIASEFQTTCAPSAHLCVAYAGEYWAHSSDECASASVVEFDGTHHRMVLHAEDECWMYLHVEWPVFNTAIAISKAFEFTQADSTTVQYLTGCIDTQQYFGHTFRAPGLEEEMSLPPSAAQRPQPTPHTRVFDCILFFNEFAMLSLRLLALRHSVDFHIIVEARSTFTGKPKPLYFAENKHLFQEFANKIIYVEIAEMPYPNPQQINEVRYVANKVLIVKM